MNRRDFTTSIRGKAQIEEGEEEEEANMNRTPMSQSYVNSQAGQEQQQQQQQPSTSQQMDSSNQSTNSQSNQFDQQQQQQQMPQLMCATELTNLLLEFAFSVFVNKPQDIVEYAANYFNQLQQQRRNNNNNNNQQQQQQSGSGHQPTSRDQVKRASSESQRSNASQNSLADHQNNGGGGGGQMSDYDEFDDTRMVNFNTQQQQQQQQQPKLSFNRRKSVFAEQYDPAADQEDDENSRVVHSKTDEQRQRLAKAIKSIFIFRSVDQQDMTNILDAMFEVKVSAGDVVIRQGDDGDNFYVVEKGKFQIYVTQDDGLMQVRGEYEDNGSFGELALMYNQPRAATVVALTDGSLWAMDRNTFRRIVLKSAFKKRKEYEALFEKVSVLQCLNGYERMNLCDALESKRFLNGQMIIVQGDQANGMYFIESGVSVPSSSFFYQTFFKQSTLYVGTI